MSIRHLIIFLCSSGTMALHAQNLVPNPGFEVNGDCLGLPPATFCVTSWGENNGPSNMALNSPDLAHNPSFFFPPYTIDPFQGSRYMGLDCTIQNPEYIQVRLTEPMVAGRSYCVSFHASVCEYTDLLTSTLGAYFSPTQLTVNPYVTGLEAHIQGTVIQDFTVWTKISGTYTATGGEEFITLGGFENAATNPNADHFGYMYIDFVEVYTISSSLSLGNDRPICSGESIVLNAGDDGTAYLWSTGQTTSAITVTQPGTYTVEKFHGECSVTDVVVLTSEGCGASPEEPGEPEEPEEPGNPPVPPVTGPVIPEPEEITGTLYLPNAFTPNGDESNNRFGAKGDSIETFELTVFNRWGEVVFHSTDLNEQWDGTFRGLPAKEDLYSYAVTYQPGGRRKKQVSGHVSLLR